MTHPSLSEGFPSGCWRMPRCLSTPTTPPVSSMSGPPSRRISMTCLAGDQPTGSLVSLSFISDYLTETRCSLGSQITSSKLPILRSHRVLRDTMVSGAMCPGTVVDRGANTLVLRLYRAVVCCALGPFSSAFPLVI